MIKRISLAWLGAWLTVMPLLWWLLPTIANMPMPIRAFILSGIMVLLLQTVTMPILNKLLYRLKRAA